MFFHPSLEEISALVGREPFPALKKSKGLSGISGEILNFI
jgi:hypothetical protein